jgi:hypothetical protein
MSFIERAIRIDAPPLSPLIIPSSRRNMDLQAAGSKRRSEQRVRS